MNNSILSRWRDRLVAGASFRPRISAEEWRAIAWFTVVSGAVLIAASHFSLAPKPTPVVVASVAALSGQAPADQPLPARIEVDATGSDEPDPMMLRTVADSVAAVAGTDPAALWPQDASSTEELAARQPQWFVWGGLGAPHLPAVSHTPLTLASDALQVYAVRPIEGATVCIVNHSGQKIQTRLQIRLPRGVYKIERLIFTPGAGVASRRAAQVLPAGADIAASPEASLRRLESCDLAHAAVVTKVGMLDAGAVCLYRYTNESRAAWRGWTQMQDHLHLLAVKSPGLARRLRRMLRETMDGVNCLTSGQGRRSGVESRLAGIHHLLLGTAQAEALARNYQTRGWIDQNVGKGVMEAFARLATALSETSAGILGLAPQITVVPLDEDLRGSEGEGDASKRALVTISLANNGTRSAALVKIGLNISALPARTTCEPADPAFFGTLHPGQTVQATFHLRYVNPLSEGNCMGDVSYFAADVPAHLRPQPWLKAADAP